MKCDLTRSQAPRFVEFYTVGRSDLFIRLASPAHIKIFLRTVLIFILRKSSENWTYNVELHYSLINGQLIYAYYFFV